MPRKRRTPYAILGLLAWKPMSGYDIKRLVEMGLSHFWSESYGSLFPALNGLVDEGLATRRDAPSSGRRRRHLYSITARGRRVFERWLAEPAEPLAQRNEMLLKFFLASRRPAGECIRLLEQYREQQEERLALYKASEPILEAAIRSGKRPEELEAVLGAIPDRVRRASRTTNENDSGTNELLVFYLTLRHGIRAVEARLDWIDESVRSLDAGRPVKKSSPSPSRR